MSRYYHSSGSSYRSVECICCSLPMAGIYHPEIRDTCAECGGSSKVERPEDFRAGLHREWLQRYRDLRAEAKAQRIAAIRKNSA